MIGEKWSLFQKLTEDKYVSEVSTKALTTSYIVNHNGLAWLGLAWLGLAWLGLAWCACARCLSFFKTEYRLNNINQELTSI